MPLQTVFYGLGNGQKGDGTDSNWEVVRALPGWHQAFCDENDGSRSLCRLTSPNEHCWASTTWGNIPEGAGKPLSDYENRRFVANHVW